MPNSVIQAEFGSKGDTECARNTTKGAVLIGYLECKTLVAFSVYDTNPVHFLSIACEHLKWVPLIETSLTRIQERM